MSNLKQLQYTALSLFTFTLLALGPMDAQAQEEPGAFFIGVSGGLSQADYSDVQSSSSRQGSAVGVDLTYNFNEVFSGELGAYHIRKGAEDVTSIGDIPFLDALDFQNADLMVDYYEFPIFFKLTAPIQAPVRLRAYAGPSVSFIRTAWINGSDMREDIQAEQSASERFPFFDVGANLGGEIAVPLPYPFVDEIVVDGRYNFGFINADGTNGFDMKTRTLTGTFSLRFPL